MKANITRPMLALATMATMGFTSQATIVAAMSIDSANNGNLRATGEKSSRYDRFMNALQDDEDLANYSASNRFNSKHRTVNKSYYFGSRQHDSSSSNSSSSFGASINDLLSWPLKFFSSNDNAVLTTPDYSNYSTIPQYYDNSANFMNKNDRQNRRLNSSGPGIPTEYYRPPIVVAHDVHPPPQHDDIHEMVVHVTYEDIYAIIVFLIDATAMGILTAKLGMPALVGEIITGFVLGPPLANFVPFPEAMVLVGEIGLIMLLLEAGVELDVAQLKETGVRALAIGITGTVLPLLVGLGLATAGGAPIKSAMAVGASFSPTSLGVAASALKSGKMLDTPVGQLIVASCVVDDILALILLSMFQVLVLPEPSIIQYFIPIISSVGFLIVLGGSAVTWLPKFIENKILNKCKPDQRELVMFSIMTVMLLAYLPLLNYTKASYLTGAFLAGCTFSQIESAHHQFMEKTHQLMTWLLRVFFAASIGFQVPVSQFSDPYVIGWGFILYLCVAAKLPLAAYVPQFEDVKKGASYNPFIRDRIITALAMTCRGEFSFIIAAFALGEGLLTARMYAAIVWAVLLSCITSPFMLLNLIKYFNQKKAAYLADTNPLKKFKKGEEVMTPLFLHVKVVSPVYNGMQEQFRAILNELGLDVIERRTNREGRGLEAMVQTDLYVRDNNVMTHVMKIKAQKKIKRALASVEGGSEVEIMGGNNKKSLYRRRSSQLSSQSLSTLELDHLAKEETELLQKTAKEQDAIISRGAEIEKKIEEALGEQSKVEVDVWSPWPWTEVLDTICDHYGLGEEYGEEKLDIFISIFDKIDSDGGGSIDMDEMYKALSNAGIEISDEGVLSLFAMIDEDGDGDVVRDEWKDTIEFYLELKAEESEMKNLAAVAARKNNMDIQKEMKRKMLKDMGYTSVRVPAQRGSMPMVDEDAEDDVEVVTAMPTGKLDKSTTESSGDGDSKEDVGMLIE